VARLLKEPRVVLLSEAGSGKTEEIRHVCRDLRERKSHAFFLRIEHLVQDFEASFEEGTLEEFHAWTSSSDAGWLLLDSVDEARLKDPRDFDLAIRKVGLKLRGALQRARIVITGRTDAWRPKTDLMTCETFLPWKRPDSAFAELQESDEVATFTDARSEPRWKSPFRIVALDNLRGEQIDKFATAKGVRDIKEFKNAIDRADAWSFTARPLDLAEVVEFWNSHRKLGSPLDLMRASIDKRLGERDQNRAEANPISRERIRHGARLVAAASTLAKESAIRVPDGEQNNRGLAIKEILHDWNDADARTLLTRPIFDEGIYGTVRFHHRSVREFLTAEWLNSLLVDEGSRVRIENLFFRRQYGIEVVVPTMRPILPWLALFDQRILTCIMTVAPEVLFEGGDPARLPTETRAQALREACEQLAQPAHARSVSDYSSVQRFANPDLADIIRELLQKYKEDDDIVWFLLRMVYQGNVGALANEAKHFALTSRGIYTRAAAIRAVLEVGSPGDADEVRKTFLAEGAPLRRTWFGELVDRLGESQDDVDWLIAGLELVAPKEQFETDPLSNSLEGYVAALPSSLLPRLLQGLGRLLGRTPVVDPHYCEISKSYGWLGQAAGGALLRMIEQRDPATLEKTALLILRQLPIAEKFGRDLFEEIRGGLREKVRAWPELNRELFWHTVAEERARLVRVNGDRLINYQRASMFGSYWAFDASSFNDICSQIAQRPLTDDKLVALTLAFSLYLQNGRPRAWRERLKKAVGQNAEVETELTKLLRPPKGFNSSFRREQAAFKRRSEKKAAEQIAAQEKSKEILASRVATIRQLGETGRASGDHRYLYDRMRASDNQHDSWTEGRWRSLIPTFGQDVALAFRDGVVGFWRQYKPQLRSEGAIANGTPFSTILGLTGLAIEAREEPDWPSDLTPTEAEIATRYALHELNGFSAWLPQIYKVFPRQVLDIILLEIRHELSTEISEGESHHTLYDVSWHGDWLWDGIAPAILQELRKERVNSRNLQYLLAIVNRSSVVDKDLAAVASRAATAAGDLALAPIWFATWVGVDPGAAIPSLAARLAEISDPAQQTKLALSFIVALVGGRSQSGRARQAFRTVQHIKSLYLLMTRYIRQKDDIERAGQGVYSPGLRDDAQDARDTLIAFIRETPGKAAFLALLEMARAHPDEESRPWMGYHAKAKAAADADLSAWTQAQVREFDKSLVATPSNHRELWYHAVDKLDSLKHDLENGDSSVASILRVVDQETEFRKFIGGWCRDRAAGRYVVPQEEELADAKRPDLRFFGVGFDAPVPAELKLADKWTGPRLFERLEVQLCGDYLRDIRSSRGIFLLVYLGKRSYWDLPNGRRVDTFETLVDELQRHWILISSDYPGVEDIRIIGIDLTRRDDNSKAATKPGEAAGICLGEE
jgi:hypothetical protein